MGPQDSIVWNCTRPKDVQGKNTCGQERDFIPILGYGHRSIIRDLHIFTYIYIYLHIFTYIYIYLHIFTYVYIYLHIFTYIYIYLHIFTYNPDGEITITHKQIMSWRRPGHLSHLLPGSRRWHQIEAKSTKAGPGAVKTDEFPTRVPQNAFYNRKNGWWMRKSYLDGWFQKSYLFHGKSHGKSYINIDGWERWENPGYPVT